MKESLIIVASDFLTIYICLQFLSNVIISNKIIGIFQSTRSHVVFIYLFYNSLSVSVKHCLKNIKAELKGVKARMLKHGSHRGVKELK